MEEWGSCERLECPDRFLLRINGNIPDDYALLIFIHEWSHAKVWGDDPNETAHGPLWGITFSRCYAALFDA